MRTIMIVDDERILREAFAAYFGDHQWHTITAENGEEALTILENSFPDAVLVDIRLPGMGGDEFIRKATTQNAQMGFVICTGSPEYTLPPDLQKNPRVSNQVFRKPVAGLVDLENELAKIISSTEK